MDSDDDLEFEGSDDEFEGAEPRRDSRYAAEVQEWSQQQPEAEVRFIREDPDECCVVLELCGTEFQIYIPQDEDSNFFVTTDDDDAKVNSMLIELNDMPHIRALPALLSEASRLLGAGPCKPPKLARVCSDSIADGVTKPGLQRSRSAVVLGMESLQQMQDELIDRVASNLAVEASVAALLLLHAQWDEERLHERLAADGDSFRHKAGVALPPGELPAPQPQLCCVCFADEATKFLSCGHGLCEDDWPGFLKCNLDSGTVGGENCLRLKCPGERCRLLVPSRHFQAFLSPEDFKRYRSLQVLSFVNDNPNIVWCPATGCELCVGFSRRKSTVRCNCNHWFCFSCKLPAHAPAKCSSAKAWLEKKEKMQGLQHCPRAVGTAKPCPNPDCQVLSHKESGCHYLHCPHCKEKWCWQCGDWGGGPSGRPEPHHVFDCNNPINQQWAKAAVSANVFDNEGRYWFYFERHENHLGSLTFAEDLRAKLPEQVLGGVELNPPEIARDYSSVLNFDMVGTGCAQSMLDSSQAWTAGRDYVGEWLQLDLGKVCSVTGVVVQGHADEPEWVTQFRVEHGATSIRPDGVVGEFRGNTDSTSKVQVVFPMPISTRYLRLAPLSWERRISLRAGVLVLNEAGDQEWSCTACTMLNGKDAAVCSVCEAPRPCKQEEDVTDVKRKQDARCLVLDASELLVECRLVLAWTYVWAFFEKDVVKRELFEFVQKDLETKTEQLSGMIENQPLGAVLRERLQLLDYVSALRGYLENIKEYTCIDPDQEVPKN